jgi:hypothetical protein
MHRLGPNDLQRTFADATPRRVALGRLSAVAMGMLSALGLRQRADISTNAKGGTNGNKQRHKKRKPSGPTWSITRVHGAQFNVSPGSPGGGCAACPDKSDAIGGGVLGGRNECSLVSSWRPTRTEWCVSVRCPAVGSVAYNFIPEVICIS